MTIENHLQNQEDKTLPYGTSGDSVLKLLDAIKKKQGDEKGIRAIYSGGKFDSTRKSLEILGIIEGLNLLPVGKELIYETNESKRQATFLKVILNYPPYEYFLTYIHQNMSSDETDIDLIKNFWGRNDYGSSPNNRDEAVSVFCNFIALAGVGEYIVGRRGKNSRIKWSSNVPQIIENFMAKLPQQSDEVENDNADTVIEKADISLENREKTLSSESLSVNDNLIGTIKIIPNISINVDMSEWDTEKIIAFFKAAYGDYNNDNK